MAHVRAHVNLSRGAPVSLTRSFIYNFGSFDRRDTLPAAERFRRGKNRSNDSILYMARQLTLELWSYDPFASRPLARQLASPYFLLVATPNYVVD